MSQAPLSVSEAANLWSTYQKKTMLICILEHAIEVCSNQEIINLLKFTYQEEKKFVSQITSLLIGGNTVTPIGFTDQDVNSGAPPLFDDFFYVSFIRTIMKLGIALNAIHLSMAYREDITDLFKRTSSHSNSIYTKCTNLLQSEGFLARPPVVTLPKENKMVHDKSYISGLHTKKRKLNAVEISLLFHGIENNFFAIQLLNGFIQVAEHDEVKEYFQKGKRLAKEIVQDFHELLLESDIQSPNNSVGTPKDTKEAPFSDKLMMFLINLFSSFGLTSNALSTSFSLRPDLPIKMTLAARDIFTYTKEGGKIMIRNNWMEEPPQS
jgi:hypothetical protein